MKWKSRKFIVLMCALIVTALFRWFSKIESPEYVDLFKWIFGIYVFGNVGQKYIVDKKE